MKFAFSFVLTALLFISCGNNQNETATHTDETEATDHVMPVNNSDKYAHLQFAIEKDPVCMMPLSAGISDTAVIDGKIYGFCAPQCKETYVKEHRK